MPEIKIFDALPEEEILAQMADPCNMCDAVGDRMVEIMEQKLARWKYRLMKKEDVDVPEE